MFISEDSIDLYLLENYPQRFVSLYDKNSLNEGTFSDLKGVLANVTKNIGSDLDKSGVDTKQVTKEIRKELETSKNTILEHLKKGDSFEASNELNRTIDKIWFKIREYYKSKGIVGKSILILLFLFIVIMAVLLSVWILMYHAIVFVLLIVIIPVVLSLLKISLGILKFRHKSNIGFPSNELNRTIVKSSEKLGVDNRLVVNFLSSTTKKVTDKVQKDFDRAIEKKTNDPKGKFTTRAILMIVKTIKDQTGSGLF